MTVQVETLDKLERRITLTLPTATISSEVESRLKKLSRTVKADGFRPGKVPMSVVAQRYGYSVHYEVMNDKVGQVFSEAVNEAKLRVAGAPKIAEKASTKPEARRQGSVPLAAQVARASGPPSCWAAGPVARVAKLVDAPGLGPDASDGVRVRVPPRAPALQIERVQPS